MNAQERFDCYISEIEEMAEKSECYKPNEIAEKLLLSHGIGIRDLNAIFVFLTESSLIHYIRERQMMAAYKAIISLEKFNVEIGISITGYSDQSAFGKKFKQRFGVTPKEAFESKDISKYVEKLSWDALTNDKSFHESTTIELKPVKTKFGISEEQYLIANRAADLQALFDLDDYQSEKAFELTQMLDIDMKKAFEFVEEYCDHSCYCFRPNKGLSLTAPSHFLDVVNVYFNVVQNTRAAMDLVEIIDLFHYKVSEFSSAFLQMYLDNCGLPLGTLVEWAKRYGGDICTSDYIEDAIRENIDEIVRSNYSLDEAETIFDWKYDTAQEEMDYSDMQREIAEYYPISDDERAEWDDRSDDYSRRLSKALDNGAYDDGSDEHYYDFFDGAEIDSKNIDRYSFSSNDDIDEE